MDPLKEVILTPLKIISNPKGDIFRVLKKSESSFISFGEAYFSFINQGQIKGWKRHRKMTLNLIVPSGQIRFVLFDERPQSSSYGKFWEITLGPLNYQRLTIPPMIWVAFQGVGDSNLLLNIASIEHDPGEADNRELQEIVFGWEK